GARERSPLGSGREGPPVAVPASPRGDLRGREDLGRPARDRLVAPGPRRLDRVARERRVRLGADAALGRVARTPAPQTPRCRAADARHDVMNLDPKMLQWRVVGLIAALLMGLHTLI